MPTRTITIPRILKQSKNACTAYSTVMLVEYLYKQKYGVLLELDPEDFYKRCLKRAKKEEGGINLSFVCEEASEVGLKNKDGKMIKVKTFQYVSKDNVWNKVKENGPMIMSIDKETGEPLHKRLDENKILQKRKRGYHAVVPLQVDGGYLCSADPSKPELTGGYWWMKLRYKEMIRGAYYLTV